MHQIRKDDSEQKITKIENHFGEILETLGLDISDPSIDKTPHRFAKMLVNELFSGLDDSNFPKITTQENTFGYNEMLIESNIKIHSVCEHHFMPILGVCHIAYIPNRKIIGLSKLNRIAQFFGRRPQIQERLTKEIETSLKNVLETDDVAVVVDALHLCVRMRGIEDVNSLTRTLALSGKFAQGALRQEFLAAIPRLQDTKI